MKILKTIFLPALAAVLGIIASSCSDSKSYADLLNEENKAVNLYLANQRVSDVIPEDGNFEVGEDAPFYQLDEDGNVFMQVLSKGDTEKAEEGARVYFRFIRYNLRYYAPGEKLVGSGNAEDMSTTSMYFIYDDFQNTNSATYGEGIQMPLKYLGYNCKVNLIVKSQDGWSDEISNVIPFLYTISYFKSQI